VSRVKVTVLSDSSAPSLVLSFLPAFAQTAGISTEDAARLQGLVEGLVRFTLEHAYPDDDLGELEVTIEAADDRVYVDVHDWGLPLTSAGGDFGPLPDGLIGLPPEAEDVQLLNLGAEGKRLTARLRVRAAAATADGRHHVEASPRRPQPAARSLQAVEVRDAAAGDAEGIAQLLYENYHLSYVHPGFYRPRHLMEEIEAGRLASTIAVHEDRVIGHHALMPEPGSPSAESGAAVVHSAYRGLGIFNQLFARTFERARERVLAAVYGDAVTIHPFSQRAEASHGYREAALQLGMLPARTTMRGFGGDGREHRTATIRSYLVLDRADRAVALPTRYRGFLEDVYERLGLGVTPRRSVVTVAGDTVTTADDRTRALGFLHVRRWDERAGAEIVRGVRQLLARHADVVYADIDLAAVENVDAAVARLNELGFFIAGLIVHGPDGHDHVRLQRLDSEDVELEAIVCDSAFSQELHARVLEDKAAVDGWLSPSG
jgi:N-acetylglutamate synthase-like GNAT family acetyltransferase